MMWVWYIVGLAYLVVGLFGLSVWHWLRANPVLPLNWDYERRYHRPVTRYEVQSGLLNLSPVYASSASCVLPIAIVEHRRSRERVFWE